MNFVEYFLLVFSVAFMSLQKATDAKEYTIPEANPNQQSFSIDGGSMSGSTLIYDNYRGRDVKFGFYLTKTNNPNATVSFYANNETKVYNSNFELTVNGTSINFSLSSSWSAGDTGNAVYTTVNGPPEDGYDRNATNLPVAGAYEIQNTTGIRQRIWARDHCGVKVTLDSINAHPSDEDPDSCDTVLNFDDGRTVGESMIGETLTFPSSPVGFVINSSCAIGEVELFYSEAVSSNTTAPTSPTTSGINMVAYSPLIMIALTMAAIQ
ncbi:unnamed protein product [Calicophoron daubneyi]|uniref:Uncharacterized protein n=1 Tax=Calicophoron daubneyi TaxID=300641 RepID=A0AAV2TM09_CALDB